MLNLITSIIYTAIVMYVCLYITTALHELLHYLAAKHYGFEVEGLYIGSGLKIYDKNDIHIGLSPLGAKVIWNPKPEQLEDDDFNYKVAKVFFAGPIGNLIFLLVGIIINPINPFVSELMIMLNLMLVITNYVPIQKGEACNDGAFILKAISYQKQGLKLVE